MRKQVISSADKLKRKKKTIKLVKLILLFLILLLLILYIVFSIIYSSSSFSITLDRNLHFERGLIVYDDPDYKVYRSELAGKTLEYFDNIAGKWLPDNLSEHGGGSHNGNNYVAYTFYIENMGENLTDYWSEIIIDDVINNVDEAIRIRVYKNGEETTYAKMSKSGEPEVNTTPFESNTLVAREHTQYFGPGDLDKYTIVLWLEGNDPECTDNILGGKFKIHMDFKSEIVED